MMPATESIVCKAGTHLYYNLSNSRVSFLVLGQGLCESETVNQSVRTDMGAVSF